MARCNDDYSTSGESRDGQPVCPKCGGVRTMPDPENNFDYHYRVCTDCDTPFKWTVAFSVRPLHRCRRCGHQWEGRGGQKPRTCANPKCRSPYWDQDRVRTPRDYDAHLAASTIAEYRRRGHLSRIGEKEQTININ